MNRSSLLFLVLALSALLQARLLPEIGLERWINLPLILILLLSSVRHRATLVAAALLGGLLIDVLLWRPLGLTSATLLAASLVAASVRGDGAPGWVRRSVAALAGFAVAEAGAVLLGGLLGINGGARGSEEAPRILLNVALLVAGSVISARRRDIQRRNRPLDDRLE